MCCFIGFFSSLLEVKEGSRARTELENKNSSSFLLATIYISTLLMDSQTASSESVVTVDVHQAKELVRSSGHRYLDVRTSEEFNRGHVDIENALNIPYMFNTPQGREKNPEFLEKVSAACSKDEHLIVGCQSGVRSLYASADLLEVGFKHVINMGGGYAAWLENGLAVKKPNVIEDDEL